ncbi:SpoIID/LytB domain-containing protein, partial [Candidatus Dojkabacteria bacterium]|nr:SpoIID/LytB domain-containing protein [Candidatus Dojkabacteria bacterium]
MLRSRKLIVAALLLFTIIAPVLLGMRVTHVDARTLDEIQDEIEKQKQALGNVNASLTAAENALKSSQNSLSNAQGEIPRLEAEIAQIQAEIDLNKVQIQVAEETEKLKTLEQEERETRQDSAVKQAYVDWRSEQQVMKALVVGTADNVRAEVYQSQVAKQELNGIEILGSEIDELKDNIDELEGTTTDLETKNADLTNRKAQLEAQIIALRNSVNWSNGQVAGLRSQATVLQANIDQLSAEQKALQDYEAWLLGQGGNGGSQPLSPGQIYFTGAGRELYTGHGVGMSQYGAYGLAQNGWGASQILTHYYTGVVVGQYPASQEITIKYCQGSPVFAAYQNGCMSGGVYYGPEVVERVSLDQYLAGLGEMPNSWPLEARKAQMIAARTYALRYTANGNPNNPICLTTYCQVSYIKSGDVAEMDAVQQTKDLVITYGGNLIEALYSADNNNGWGTA